MRSKKDLDISYHGEWKISTLLGVIIIHMESESFDKERVQWYVNFFNWELYFEITWVTIDPVAIRIRLGFTVISFISDTSQWISKICFGPTFPVVQYLCTKIKNYAIILHLVWLSVVLDLKKSVRQIYLIILYEMYTVLSWN